MTTRSLVYLQSTVHALHRYLFSIQYRRTPSSTGQPVAECKMPLMWALRD